MLDEAAEVSFLKLKPLEAHGEGHLPAARKALEGPAKLLVFCIRPHVLAPIGLDLPDPVDGLELPQDEPDFDAFAERIAKLAAAAPQP